VSQKKPSLSEISCGKYYSCWREIHLEFLRNQKSDKYVTHMLQMMTMVMMRGTHHDNAGRGKGDVNGGDANGKKSDLEKLT